LPSRIACAVVNCVPTKPALKRAGSSKPIACWWQDAQDTASFTLSRLSLNSTRPSVATRFDTGSASGVLSIARTRPS